MAQAPKPPVPNRRPKTKYTPEILAAIARAAEAGATDQEIIEAVGCNRRTYYRWRERYPELQQVLLNAESRKVDYAAIAKLEERKVWANQWIDRYLQTQGETVEECDGDGLGSYVKKKSGRPPDMRLIDRILGTSGGEKFEVVISVATPESDDDDFDGSDDFDDDDFDDDDDDDID
jgi:Homeodomain-like domain